MKDQLRLLAVICCTHFFLTSCAQEPNRTVAPNNSFIDYMGRVKVGDTATELYWSGTSVSLTFEGTSLKAMLEDEKGSNYFYVLVDDKEPLKIKIDTGKHDYDLLRGLSKGKHTVTLSKLTEGTMGKTLFYGFTVSGNTKLLPAVPKAHTMEYYGNSITSGYSADDEAGDRGDAQYFNHYHTYAALTARHLGARYHCISKSGIGFMVSWFPIIMPEMYERTDPNDSNSHWDFASFTPEVVVVDLGQNDSWLIKKTQHPQFLARFGETAPDSAAIVSAYKKWIMLLRNKYPSAFIVCTLGSMDVTEAGSPWPAYVSAAVNELNDKQIATLYFPYKNGRGHPKRKDHALMAESLEQFIKQQLHW